MILVLLLVTATFHPPAPTVGDRITIDFASPVVLDASPDFELVEQRANRVVIRTFRPRPFALSGVAGGVRFRNLRVPVKSVLKPKDALQPAPLVPPQHVPYPRAPFIAIAVAALLAAVGWAAVFALQRRAGRVLRGEPAIAADDRFRLAVEALRFSRRKPQRWAALADATREFLAAQWPRLGPELTTAELLHALSAVPPVHPSWSLETMRDPLAWLLHQGDLEKFAPWGEPSGDFDAAAAQALELIPPPPPVSEEVAA